MLSCAEEFKSAYDIEACEENIALLPVDIGVGGAIMSLLVLPPVLFYFGLCFKRWKRVKGSECPFLGGPALNRCRCCGTHVSERAFHRTCSVTTQQQHGNVVTVTTTTTHNWDHCAGCHFLKAAGLMIVFLLAMFGVWGYTVVERLLAVLGVTYRDERVWSFNITMYCLTVIVGLVACSMVWCTRKPLLKFTCLTPCGCCCATSSSHEAAARSGGPRGGTAPAPVVVAASIIAPHTAEEQGGVAMATTTPAARPPLVAGVPVCSSV